MPSTSVQHHPFPAPRSDDQPLAPSASSGAARLRELEHLAETARRVRAQAAAELARPGSTHHIARDRIAAAERMLHKAKKEIAELRAALGTAHPSLPQPPMPRPASAAQDFELAVLLGHHGTTRRSQGGQNASGLQLERGKPAPRRPQTAAGTTTKTTGTVPSRAAASRHAAAPVSRGHRLALGLLVVFGVGLAGFGLHMLSGAGA